MKVLDLFSGIGGFSLGLERAGMTTVAFCEIEPFCRQILRKHWPEVPIYEDIRELTADTLRSDGIAVDVICGGFPCQDISVAGKGAGLQGARSGLWSEYRRLIREIRPQWVIIENVPAILTRGGSTVANDLAASGYDCLWECIPASAVGAPHKRDRWWCIAYANGERCRHKPKRPNSVRLPQRQTTQAFRCADRPLSAVRGVDDGLPYRVDQLRALGNAVVPQIPEMIGRSIVEAESSLMRDAA